MTRYFKKPTSVDAWQVTDLNSEHTQRMPPQWVIKLMLSGNLKEYGNNGTLCLTRDMPPIVTYVEIGGWLVKDDTDVIRGLSDTFFKENYEAYPEPKHDRS